MAFPQTPLEARVDLLVDGAWSNVTGDVLVRDAIVIARGRADETSQADPSTANLTLENRDGRYSPRNPLGALYGKIGRNTRMRVGVGTPAIAAAASTSVDSTSLVAPSVTAEVASTLFCVWGASPAGDVTGPGGFSMITPERDGTSSTWASGLKSVAAGATGTSTATHSVTATDQACVAVAVPGGSIVSGGFSAIGTSRQGFALSVTSVAAGDYLLAIQGWSADPDNRLTVAPAVQGMEGLDWVDLADSGPASGPRVRAWIARMPAGVASSLSVRFDGYDPPNTLPISNGGDNFGRVWRLNGVTDYFPRHVGEVSSWPQRWDLAGVDVQSPVTSSGILRRLGQGSAPLRSPLNRHIVNSANVVAYWPCEESAENTSFASPIDGVDPAGYRGTPVLAADDGFYASEPLPTWLGAGFAGTVPDYAATGELFMGALYAIPAAGMASGPNLLSVGFTGGSIAWAVLEYRVGGDLAIKLYDRTSTTTPIVDSATNFDYDGDRFFAWIWLAQNGADVQYRINAIGIVDGDYSPIIGQAISVGTAAGQSLGRARSVTAGIEGFNASNGALSLTAEVSIGHITIAKKAQAVFRSDFLHYYPAVVGYYSEGAVERITRLCREEGIDVLGHYDQPASSGPYAADSTALGPQRTGTLLELLAQAAEADGGVLYEPRGFLGLAYRSRASRQNQASDVTLSYTGGHIAEPFEPVDDDQNTRNDVTVTRIGGTSARAELTSGALSTQAPPDGVGRYDEAVDLSLWRDSQAADVASWRLHLGTWDEARYPQVTTYLEKTPANIPAVAALDCADQVALASLPAWLPPGPAEISVEGYSERLEPFAWRLTFNASPAGPYRVPELDDTQLGRLDSEDSTLAAAVSSSATSLPVAVADGSPLWITTSGYPTEFPFDAVVGGELVTVSAIAGAVEDTFARSVTDGWGTATSGQVYAYAGAQADFDVNGSYGTWTGASAVNSFEAASLPVSYTDIDVRATFRCESTPTGGDILAEVTGRVGGAADVLGRMRWTAASALNIFIVGGNAGAVLATWNSVMTAAVGVDIHARLQAFGTTLRFKVWKGAVEPPMWHLEVTDTVPADAGGVGARFARTTGNTNVNPIVRCDNLRLENPQLFTVARSANGIVKAQPAGAQIRLNKPVYVAQGGDA